MDPLHSPCEATEHSATCGSDKGFMPARPNAGMLLHPLISSWTHAKARAHCSSTSIIRRLTEEGGEPWSAQGWRPSAVTSLAAATKVLRDDRATAAAARSLGGVLWPLDAWLLPPEAARPRQLGRELSMVWHALHLVRSVLAVRACAHGGRQPKCAHQAGRPEE